MKIEYNFLSVTSIVCYEIVFYLNKLLMPFKLCCLYPIYNFYYNFKFSLFYLGNIAIFLALIALVVISLKYTRKVIFGALFFLISLLPILQLFPNSTIIVAERYTYIASIGIFLMFSFFIYWLYTQKLRRPAAKIILIALLAYFILDYSFLTLARCRVWRDGVTLWSDALSNYSLRTSIYNNKVVAYNNLGDAYVKAGEYDNAIVVFARAIEINPASAEAHNNMGIALSYINEHNQAIAEFSRALKIDPGFANAYSNMCFSYGNIGNYKEAIKTCRRALELDPLSGHAHYNLSVAYYFNKEYAKSKEHLDTALELGWKPNPQYLKAIKQVI